MAATNRHTESRAGQHIDRHLPLAWMGSSWTVSLALVGLFVLAWETIKVTAGFPKAVLPHLWEVATYLGSPTSDGSPFGLYLINNMGVTFREAIVGLLVGACCGVVSGTLIGLSRRVGRGLLPLVVASQTVPIIAIAPAIVIWLGTGWLTKAMIAGYLCFFPVAVTTARGFADVPVESLSLMRTFNASRLQVFLALRIPSALPMIFVGLETAAAFAVLGSLVGELPVGSSEGVGFVILSASQFYTYAPEALYAAVAGTFVTGIALVLLIKVTERIILRNRRGAAAGAS
jgi:NitT/TauT family transport system permease protein